jgi:hypothetical protein
MYDFNKINMKKNSSTQKAEWNSTREEFYMKSCLSIAFENGFALIERDSKVYKIDDSNELLICSPDKVKTIWYETWLIQKKINASL